MFKVAEKAYFQSSGDWYAFITRGIYRFLTLLQKFSITKAETLKSQAFLIFCVLFTEMRPRKTSPTHQLNHGSGSPDELTSITAQAR